MNLCLSSRKVGEILWRLICKIELITLIFGGAGGGRGEILFWPC
jgi:hypothetical protein